MENLIYVTDSNALLVELITLFFGGTFLIALAVYGIGFFDVILTCRKRRQQIPAGFPPKAGQTAYPVTQGSRAAPAVRGGSRYRTAIVVLTFLSMIGYFGAYYIPFIFRFFILSGYLAFLIGLYLPSLKPYTRTIRKIFIGYIAVVTILSIGFMFIPF